MTHKRNPTSEREKHSNGPMRGPGYKSLHLPHPSPAEKRGAQLNSVGGGLPRGTAPSSVASS